MIYCAARFHALISSGSFPMSKKKKIRKKKQKLSDSIENAEGPTTRIPKRADKKNTITPEIRIPQTYEPDGNDRRVIKGINTLSTVLFVIMTIVTVIRIKAILDDAPLQIPVWVVNVCYWTTFALSVPYGINAFQFILIAETTIPSQESTHRLRRLSIRGLTIAIMMCVFGVIPALFMHGHFKRFSNWISAYLPYPHVGEGVSLVGAFIAGAVISGILGNLSYDILKFVVKKIINRDAPLK